MPRVVIAGAGCAGLAAGLAFKKKGFQVIIVESLNRVGGLAGGVEINGNTYEYGPHVFHTTDPEILKDVLDCAGDVMIPIERTAKVKFLGKFINFPFSIPDILANLPLKTILHATFSLLYHYIKGLIPTNIPEQTSETVLRRYYGDVFYRIFFKDYISKVWGLDPGQMSPSYAYHRIPKLDLGMFFSKLVSRLPRRKKEVSIESHVEKVEGVTYTTKQGYSLIAKALAKQFEEIGGELLLESTVNKVTLVDNMCRHVHYSTNGQQNTLSCDHFVSTIPISELPKLFSPPVSEQYINAGRRLKFRPITFVGLLIDKKSSLPASYMYFRETSFNRVMDLGSFHVTVTPDDHTLLVAEITCSTSHRFWIDDDYTKTTVIDDLCKENLLDLAHVKEAHVFRTRYGYPIYHLGFENDLTAVQELLGNLPNVHSIGRQGQFAYINTHIAMKMGYELCRTISP